MPARLVFFRLRDHYETFDNAKMPARDMASNPHLAPGRQGTLVLLAGLPYRAPGACLGWLIAKGHKGASPEASYRRGSPRATARRVISYGRRSRTHPSDFDFGR